MYRLKDNPIGIYEKAMPDRLNWEQKIEIAKAAGFDFIEMSIDESDHRLARLDWDKATINQLRQVLYQNDMYINSICLSGHRRFPFGSKDPEIRQRAYQIMDQCLRLARDLGVRNIQLAGYDVYYEPSDEETIAAFIQGLKYAARKAQTAGVMLSIEIMDTDLCGTISRTLKFVQTVGSPWLNIYPDLGNLTQWTDDPEIELEIGLKYITGIHLKDTQPGVFKCVPFGQGTVRFEDLFRKLDELEYQGPFLIEMWADNTLNSSCEETIDQIKQAKDWLAQRAGGRF